MCVILSHYICGYLLCSVENQFNINIIVIKETAKLRIIGKACNVLMDTDVKWKGWGLNPGISYFKVHSFYHCGIQPSC